MSGRSLAGFSGSQTWWTGANTMRAMDTIYALSSGGLPAGVAVVRISGPQTKAIVTRLTGSLPQARLASHRAIRDLDCNLLDRGIVLLFEGPTSFTGEDSAELQLHGSKAVVGAVLRTLSQFPDTRAAEAGEFTQRAFENGRIDLIETEGLADLLRAETEMQRRLAIEQAEGGLSALYGAWAERIKRARALIEAELDFADEGDVPGSVSAQVWADMSALRVTIASHLGSADVGAMVRDGFQVVIVGRPNVGKSSLLNRLAKRDVAIVTDIPGTTRDILTVDLDLNGFAVRLSDTAGLRDSGDVVEQEGIRRARRAASSAHLVLHLGDHPSHFDDVIGIDETIPVLQIATKIDISPSLWQEIATDAAISVVSDNGIADLLQQVALRLPDLSGHQSLSIPSRERQTNQLRQTLDDLDAALSGFEQPIEVRAEHLRSAQTNLGRITGKVDVEDLLGVIFSEFCIGK